MSYDPAKPYKHDILKAIKQTWETPYVSVKSGIYPISRDKFDYKDKVDHTDGIGTKGYFHWQKGTFENAVLDSLGMNLNDFAIVLVTPYKLQNHIWVPTEDDRIMEIVNALSDECRKRQIAITGGEISYQNNLDGMDISITMSGFQKTKKPNKFKEGDWLIGIESNGIHASGFTAVRELFEGEYRPEFTEPTAIYLDAILSLDEKIDTHGRMHITGGAYTKLKGLLNNSDAILTNGHGLRPQSIFYELYKKGVSDRDMHKTFNCGIGFILSVSPKDSSEAIEHFQGNGFKADIIGEITPGTGQVKLRSMFTGEEIEF